MEYITCTQAAEKMETSDYYYVDKTLLIRDFIDNEPLVTLVCMP